MGGKDQYKTSPSSFDLWEIFFSHHVIIHKLIHFNGRNESDWLTITFVHVNNQETRF
jgi:hypothetical protein